MPALAALDDPIVAVATAPGRGAVGIVRVSGAHLQPLALALTGKHLTPRHAYYGPLRGADGEAIDQGLALFFPAPHSYTGEDVLELQAHGGPVVLELLVAACLTAGAAGAAPRLRLAEPGEFTQRAFLNGKLDLAQAEAVADLIDAATTAAAKSASRALAGAFSTEIHALAQGLVALRLLVEATLDFPEEEIDFLERADARGRLAALRAGVAAVRARARQGQLLRDGLQVVLAGQPNVGKSSLLNALAGAEVAIVTPVAGTTRDRVRETLQIDGVPIHLIDTAGLRDAAHAADDVERIGMARTWEAVADADAVLFVHDLSRAADPAHAAADLALQTQLHAADPARVLHIHNKADLAPNALVPEGQLRLSTLTGEGLPTLRQTLLARAGWLALPEGVTIARGRHLKALDASALHIEQADALAAQGDGALDLLAEELRLAHEALQAITGQFSADDLLGEIFGHFCIGK